MSSWLPRATGVLTLAWAIAQTPGAAAFPHPVARWLYLGVWVALALLLVANRGVRFAGIVLAVLAFHRVFWPVATVTGSSQTLLGWFALILAVTEGRPTAERSLLIRVCVSCVYGFTALAKVNPAFLAGDQLVYLTETRAHLTAFQDLAASGWGVAASWATVAAEGWLAIGLWFRRTRLATALFGAGLHVVLVAAAFRGIDGIVFLTVLNGLLVVGYLAFFDQGDPVAVGDVGAERGWQRG